MITTIDRLDAVATTMATAHRKIRTAQAKLVRAAAQQAAFAESCGGDPIVMCGAIWLMAQMLSNPETRDQAHRLGLAKLQEAEAMMVAVEKVQVKASLIALGAEPEGELKALLDLKGFECVSAPKATPVHYVGTADVTMLRPLVSAANGTIGSYKAPALPVGRKPRTDRATPAKKAGSPPPSQKSPASEALDCELSPSAVMTALRQDTLAEQIEPASNLDTAQMDAPYALEVPNEGSRHSISVRDAVQSLQEPAVGPATVFSTQDPETPAAHRRPLPPVPSKVMLPLPPRPVRDTDVYPSRGEDRSRQEHNLAPLESSSS